MDKIETTEETAGGLLPLMPELQLCRALVPFPVEYGRIAIWTDDIVQITESPGGDTRDINNPTSWEVRLIYRQDRGGRGPAIRQAILTCSFDDALHVVSEALS